MKLFKKIDLQEANVLGKTAKSYLKGECNELISFFSDKNGFESALAVREKITTNREILVKVLLEQNKDASQKTIENIESLKNVNSFTVTTGHQLCLFTGPLYFIYKIVHAIKLADDLSKQFPGKKFVPVYWMASEDHDFEEVSEVNVFGKRLKWEKNSGGAVGRIKLKNDAIRIILDQLRLILGESEAATSLFTEIEKCYSGDDLASATRAFVNFLFTDYGLVVLDADDKDLKSQFKDVFTKEIEEEFVYKKVSDSSALLEKKGLKAQVTPREINIFYLAENSRERIVFENNLYFTADFKKEWTNTQLLAEINLHPENFSPNVLMRGMYQERILPNLVYIGGGGEISYWLQMRSMFEAAEIFFPVLQVRNSFMIIDSHQSEKWNKLGFETDDLFKSEEELINLFLSGNKTTEIELEMEKDDLKKIYAVIIDKLADADITLRSSGEAELQKTLRSIENLEGKIRRAEKQKHETSLNQIKQIKGRLFPGNGLQERHDNFIPYYLKSNGELVKILLANMEGLKSELILMVQ